MCKQGTNPAPGRTCGEKKCLLQKSSADKKMILKQFLKNVNLIKHKQCGDKLNMIFFELRNRYSHAYSFYSNSVGNKIQYSIECV